MCWDVGGKTKGSVPLCCDMQNSDAGVTLVKSGFGMCTGPLSIFAGEVNVNVLFDISRFVVNKSYRFVTSTIW